MKQSKLSAVAYWALPSLVCLLIYWPGLKAWFLQDDFAWLGLRLSIFNWTDFWHAMFSPMAQGTIRPWSERGYFLLFEKLFGMDALPFRIWAFLTQFANLVLLSAIAWRVTGLRAAGFLAPIFWLANNGLVSPMSWSSSYNQILCSLFLLTGFYLFLRYIDTGRTRYYIAQWITFLIGFGALELNIVYPALLAAYALLCAPRFFLKTLPMFAVSAAYYLLHNHFSPKQTEGVYAMHWDPHSLWLTLRTYTLWAINVTRLKNIGWNHPTIGSWAAAILLIFLVCFVICKALQGNRLGLFCIAWFVIVLGPLLPLRDHLTDYYLTIPSIGLAILLSWALADNWDRGIAPGAIAFCITAVYLASGVALAHTATQWHYERSIRVRNLIWSVQRAHEQHPKSVILLKDVDSLIFWSSLADSPFRLVGIEDVYLTPESLRSVEPHPELADLNEFVLPPSVTAKALKQGNAVVYDASQIPLRNITSVYERTFLASYTPQLPQRVEPASPFFSDQLGNSWYPAEEGHRWMGKEAEVLIGGPTSVTQRIWFSGYTPSQLLAQGPLTVQVNVDGKPAGSFELRANDESFERSLPVPAESVGHSQVRIQIVPGRIYSPPSDGRQLSLAFGKIAIR